MNNKNSKLLGMTKEQLWRLFPVQLVPHDGRWRAFYSEMEKILLEKLSVPGAVRISHVGSTAIDGIQAKPIVDILVEIADGCDMGAAARAIEDCGFLKMSESRGRASFNCGYTEEGFAEKVYHLHLRYFSDNDELYFRDYLNDNPHIAKEYESLKLRLWKKFEFDRDAYTEAKTEFIRYHTAKAKELYGKRY